MNLLTIYDDDQRLRECIAAMDLDGDGIIPVEELRLYMDLYGE